MADIHIDDFYRDVAKILTLLYGVFPRKTALFVEDVSGPDEPDEFGLHHPRFQACFSTMIWLAEHGYLLYRDTIRDEALDQAVLSQKAFLVLTTQWDAELDQGVPEPVPPPGAGRVRQTNVSRLRHALRERSSYLLRDAVSHVLGHPAVAGGTSWPASTR